MNLLFCDQSLLHFGFCIVQASTEFCQMKTYGLLQLNGKIHYVDRLIEIENWLVHILVEHDINQVVAEEIQFQRNVQTFRKLCILQYTIESVCRRNNIAFAKPLQVHVWRTHGVKKLLQLPDGGKLALYHYLNKHLGHPDHFDTNQSDAIGMAMHWCAEQYPNTPLLLSPARQYITKGYGIC